MLRRVRNCWCYYYYYYYYYYSVIYAGRVLRFSAVFDAVDVGAALGPLLTGIISPTGWQNVFYMLISADVSALAICLYIYFKYDRGSPAVVATSLDGTGECHCRVNVKPPCCRLTLYHWLLISVSVLVLMLVIVLLPDAYFHAHPR